ncbi:diguanylate cyclase (GGDEF) domain-containing protein [Mariprofundus ferrinatatus]|uniref:Diguanylate cyclase (GGDEF) domain-containing protein n=1 Tax=Mariprofundus ferrinatatus TaxID=1921087 RepID=A0A2K8L3A0_9PROT|nr:bifunctional diguanylate cyclase/phosphodiesterase [Mariprofundus ferrinatatus]ATX81808.1 diguanylate cyclase (GGDEF) domain-containing protein [Mariprofundus ferrinatatus]
MAESGVDSQLYDALTGLPNRTLLYDRLKHEIDVADRARTSLALMHIDPFPFSDINSTLGFDVGDELLIQFAGRLQTIVRRADTVAHLSSDEFAILLPTVSDELIATVVSKLLSCFELPFMIHGESIFLGLNVGVATYPLNCASPDEMVHGAMMATKEAKARKEPVVSYSGDMAQQASENLQMFGALRRAIHSEMLELNFQPQVDIKSGKVVGVEALTRWDTAEIPPAKFIPLAETTGLICDLTEWMLNASIRQVGIWQRSGVNRNLSVNISTHDLLNPKFVSSVLKRIDEHGISSSPITFEVTENSVMRHVHHAIKTLHQLNEAGFRVSIDNFGTGYSSLAYLKNIPAHELKIDRSFVIGLNSNPSNQKVVRAVISLAHEFELSVVAEGVQTTEELELLSSYGCDIAQGFLTGKPVPASEIS